MKSFCLPALSSLMCIYLRGSQGAASHSESQHWGGGRKWACDSGSVNHMGLCSLQERQKETGAVYKLLAVIESLEAQHRVSSIVISDSVSQPLCSIVSEAMAPDPRPPLLCVCFSGLAWPPGFLSPSELASHPN